MSWVLMGIFVADMTFYFRILEIHSTHIECLYAGEQMIQKIGKPFVNYNVVCVPTNQIQEGMS
tara:strand:- start:932 stop:1120 length:189 start_codon:yes stop_codon:yes gene_type:complete